MILQLFGVNFVFEIAQKHCTKTLKQSLLWWNYGKPFLSIIKKIIVWSLIMLVAKDNANPKWLLVTKNVPIENSVTKNVMIEKLAIENVATESWQTKMWWLKTNDQKHDNRKLWRTKHVAIKICCDQNSWQSNFVTTKNMWWPKCVASKFFWQLKF